MKAFIQALDYYVPERLLTNLDLAQEFPEWDAEKIMSKVGIKERHVAAESETSSDLAVRAAEKMFDRGLVKKEDIDFVLFCTQSPDYLLPTTACIIQNRLGLSKKCGALDYNLGCSGYVYGLALAKGLLCGGVAKRILLLTGETYTKRIHPKDKSNRSLFGDGASATVVANEGFFEIGDFCLGTDGSGSQNLIIKTGGMRSPSPINDFCFDENEVPKSSDHLFMDGGEIFSFTLTEVPKLVRDTLAANNISAESIDLYVFHQANKYMLEHLRKRLKIDVERFFYYLENVGNTVSTTIPIALVEAIKDGRIKKDTKVLISGFGVGYSWGGCVLRAKPAE
jgi:3-oxoacyl-[acyl-carrier-protein] synthase III